MTSCSPAPYSVLKKEDPRKIITNFNALLYLEKYKKSQPDFFNQYSKKLRAWKIIFARFFIEKVTDWETNTEAQNFKTRWDELVPDFEVDTPDGKGKVKKTFEELHIDDKIDGEYVVPLFSDWRP